MIRAVTTILTFRMACRRLGRAARGRVHVLRLARGRDRMVRSTRMRMSNLIRTTTDGATAEAPQAPPAPCAAATAGASRAKAIECELIAAGRVAILLLHPRLCRRCRLVECRRPRQRRVSTIKAGLTMKSVLLAMLQEGLSMPVAMLDTPDILADMMG